MRGRVDEARPDRGGVEGWVGFAHLCELELGLALDAAEDGREAARGECRAVATDIDEVEGLGLRAEGLEGFCGAQGEVFGDFDVFSVSSSQNLESGGLVVGKFNKVWVFLTRRPLGFG